MLTKQNIEAELSYAYLHAVASHAGFECTVAGRHADNAGIDAVVREDGRRLRPDSTFTSFELHVQLKATIAAPSLIDDRYSFPLQRAHYDKLRRTNVASPRILVVLYLPADSSAWLAHSEERLVLQRCAYWTSLRGAPESDNHERHTVYLPRSNALSTDGLTRLMTRISCNETMSYAT